MGRPAIKQPGPKEKMGSESKSQSRQILPPSATGGCRWMAAQDPSRLDILWP